MKNKDTNYHNIIAQNLKKLRVSSKLSQEKFAEKLNCSREFISRVENFHERLSLNMLLQILDDGRLTDSHGRVVNFKNTVIIMTSNIGARLITDKKTLGFVSKENEQEQIEYEKTKKEVLAELKKQFRPEFINRIDEIIVFHKLTSEEIKKIADIMLKQIQNRLEEKGITLEIDEKAKEFITKKGTDSGYGARPLRRTIQTMVEDKIAEDIIEGNLKVGDKAIITEREEKLVVEKT